MCTCVRPWNKAISGICKQQRTRPTWMYALVKSVALMFVDILCSIPDAWIRLCEKHNDLWLHCIHTFLKTLFPWDHTIMIKNLWILFFFRSQLSDWTHGIFYHILKLVAIICSWPCDWCCPIRNGIQKCLQFIGHFLLTVKIVPCKSYVCNTAAFCEIFRYLF